MGKKKEEIHELLQSTAQEDEELEGAVLVKWVTMMDFITPEGKRFITRTYSDGITPWDLEGLLHRGLHGNWGG